MVALNACNPRTGREKDQGFEASLGYMRPRAIFICLRLNELSYPPSGLRAVPGSSQTQLLAGGKYSLVFWVFELFY